MPLPNGNELCWVAMCPRRFNPLKVVRSTHGVPQRSFRDVSEKSRRYARFPQDTGLHVILPNVSSFLLPLLSRGLIAIDSLSNSFLPTACIGSENGGFLTEGYASN